jgi:FMN reductase
MMGSRPLKLVGFSGSVGRPSRTTALVEATLQAIGRRYALAHRHFDVTDLEPSLGAARQLSDLQEPAAGCVQSMLEADILVVGSPVYKGSYSGLFKHFFDLLPPASLAGKLVVLTATGGSERHALVVDHHLRPLFSFFACHTAPTGIYATGSEFVGHALIDGSSAARIAVLLPEVDAHVRHLRGLAADMPIAAAA